MKALRFLARLLKEAPSKRRLAKALALGNKPGDRTLTSADGTQLSARTSGDGTPVVIVHGTLDGIGAFSFLEVELARRYAVWVYDRRGRGGSRDSGEYALEREVDDLRAVIAATGTTPHVVAHSFGAVVALQARLAGVEMRSLVLYEPPINADAIDVDRVEDIRRAVDDGQLDDAIQSMAAGLAGVSEAEIGLALAIPPVRKRLRDGVGAAVRELDALRAASWDDLGPTGVPTLVLRGERRGSEAYPTAEQTAALAADGEVATLPRQGHMAHVMAPWEFITTVQSFLDQH